jgi:hypothetical protein
MRKARPILYLILLSTVAFAQNRPVLHIRNVETRQPIPYARTTGQSPVYANEQGFLVWPENFENITLTAWNFADTTIFLSLLPLKDTVPIYLRPQPEQLNEVLVNPKNKWLQNYIYGFERWQNGWLFLLQNEIYITNNTLDILYKSPIPKPEKRTPREFYTDVLGNTYLLGKDSVQQLFVTDSSLYIFPAKSIQKFDHLIKPLMAQTQQGMVYRETQEVDFDVPYLMQETGTYFEFNLKYPPLHNCGVLMLFKNTDTSFVISNSVDSSAFLAARDAFGVYVTWHIAFWQFFEINGVFDPAIKEEMGHALHSYKTLFAQNRESYFLPYKNRYILFDPYSNQLITFTKKYDVIEKQPFDFTNCPREEYLYVDDATRKWWLQRRVRGLDQLESIRPGDPPKTIILDPFVRNIRVHNNVVFYITERDQFRVKKID